MAFPGILRTEDMHRIQNRCYTSSSVRRDLSFGGLLSEWLLYDEVEEDIDSLVHVVRRRACQHPADFVRQDNSVLQRGWDMHLFELSTAASYVDLTANGYAERIGTAPDGLHAQQVFTYERGSLILKSQARTYMGLTTFVKHLQYEWSRSACPLPEANEKLPRGVPCTMHQIGTVLASPDGPIERLGALLLQAGEIISPSMENCTKLVKWVSEYMVTNQDIDLIFSDGVFDAHEELIASTINKMMWLSHLSEDLKSLSALLVAGSTDSTSGSSILDTFEAVEQGICEVANAAAMELQASYRPHDGWQSLYIASTEGIDAISPLIKVQLQHEQPLCWLLIQLFDDKWPLKARISNLVTFVWNREDFFEYYIDENIIALLSLTACRLALQLMELLQPCSAVLCVQERKIRPKTSIARYDRSVNAFGRVPTNRSQLTEHWRNCIEASPSRQLYHFRSFCLGMFQHTEKIWRRVHVSTVCVEQVKDALSLADFSGCTPLADEIAVSEAAANSDVSESRPASQHSHEAAMLVIALTDTSDKARSSGPSTPERATTQQKVLTAHSSASSSRSTSRSRKKDVPEAFGHVALSSTAPRERKTRYPLPGTPSTPFESAIPHESALSDGSFVASIPRRPRLPPPDVSVAEDISVSPTLASIEKKSREKFVFTSATLYSHWRQIFPLRGEGHHPRRELDFADFREVMAAPPLNFREDYIQMPEAKFTREGVDDGESKVFTCHQLHGRRSILTAKILNNMRQRFRKNFGWEADDFSLAQH